MTAREHPTVCLEAAQRCLESDGSPLHEPLRDELRRRLALAPRPLPSVYQVHERYRGKTRRRLYFDSTRRPWRCHSPLQDLMAMCLLNPGLKVPLVGWTPQRARDALRRMKHPRELTGWTWRVTDDDAPRLLIE